MKKTINVIEVLNNYVEKTKGHHIFEINTSFILPSSGQIYEKIEENKYKLLVEKLPHYTISYNGLKEPKFNLDDIKLIIMQEYGICDINLLVFIDEPIEINGSVQWRNTSIYAELTPPTNLENKVKIIDQRIEDLNNKINELQQKVNLLNDEIIMFNNLKSKIYMNEGFDT